MVRSFHNFAHAMTGELLWHVQNCEMYACVCNIITLYSYWTPNKYKMNFQLWFQLWPHIPFVLWVPAQEGTQK